MSVNRAIIVGNVGKDPNIRAMNNGDKVATFSVATSETWKDKQTGERKEATEWHNIVVFNPNLIPIIEQFVKKGGKVSIEGAIKTRKWEADGITRYATEIVIGRFDGKLGLEGSGNGGGAGQSRDEHSYGETKIRAASPAQGAVPGGDIDDDIPF